MLIYHCFYFNTCLLYFDNSETSSALTVTAVTVVPKDSLFFAEVIQKLLLSFPSADSAYINIDKIFYFKIKILIF
jgi:hypothetical protein